MGQEFQGDAFKPTPATVLFKDFEVGQTYSQTVTVTNVSLGRTTFKVLKIICWQSCSLCLAFPFRWLLLQLHTLYAA